MGMAPSFSLGGSEPSADLDLIALYQNIGLPSIFVRTF